MTRLRSEDLVPLIPRLCRRARRLARDRSMADDLVQDTLLLLCLRLEDPDRIENLAAYAMRTLANRARRDWRPAVTSSLLDDDATIQPDALARLDCAETLAAIDRLPDRQRVLMRLVADGETSPRALARRTGVPLGTVMSRLSRARARLRAEMNGTVPK